MLYELDWAIKLLKDSGIPNASQEVRQIVNYIRGVDTANLTTNYTVDFSQFEQQAFVKYIHQRATRFPLQYILGTAPFGPLDLLVGEGVFIPRFETELLLEKTLAYLQDISLDRPLIMDLATGSGAIGLSLAKLRPNAQVILVEKELAALEWLRKNVTKQQFTPATRVKILEADITQLVNFQSYAHQVDLITFNPPYVPIGSEVAPEVAYDPATAVYADHNGLKIIEDTIPTLKLLLKNGGKFYLEHDESHAEEVKEIFATAGNFTNLSTLLDLNNKPRFLTGYYKM